MNDNGDDNGQCEWIDDWIGNFVLFTKVIACCLLPFAE